jgi:putative membrane protein
MERIKNTPLPNGFRFFPNLFTRVFCILLPIALVRSLGLATPIGSTLIGLVFLAVLSIGEDLTDPFANSVHDVPLTAMCHDRDRPSPDGGAASPEPLTPDHGVLW